MSSAENQQHTPVGNRGAPWLTYLDAAQLVGRSVPWVRENANRGLIRRRRVKGVNGRRPLVAEQDVVDLAAKLDAARARSRQLVLEPNPPAGMMSAVAAAEVLGCSRTYVHDLAARGQLTLQRGRPFSWVVADDVHQLLRTWLGGHEPVEVMTYADAAVTLGLTVDKVRALVRDGALHRVGLPRHFRLLRVEVETMANPAVGGGT